MLHKKKFSAYIITFTLLISMFSFSIFNINRVAAEDELDDSILGIVKYIQALIDFEDPLEIHPFRYVGVWESNETITITGDMEFNLYFSSTILTQLELENYKDSVNVSVYYIDNTGIPTLLENGNISFTLEPELLEDYIQNVPNVKIEGINHTVNEGDKLIFTIEVIQSDKPINDFVEKRFDTKLKNRIETIIRLLEKSNDPDLEELAALIEEALLEMDNLSIGGSEFGDLINVLRSSAFYYGCENYKSSVEFETDEGEDKTLYFQHAVNYDFEYGLSSEFGHIKVVNETSPTSETDFTMPPISINLDELTIPEVDEEEWTMWLAIWALYILEEPPSPDQNKITYYLHSDNVMDTIKPEEKNTQKQKLSDSPVEWTGNSFGRNRILKDTKADIYIYYPKLLTLSKINIKATLKYDDKAIADDTKELDRATILEKIKRGPSSPTTFEFSDINKEIWYNKNLSLEVSVSKGPLFSLFKSVMLYHDSDAYPSSITFAYEETENILLDEPVEQMVYAGGGIDYGLNVTSNHSDDLHISVEPKEQFGEWKFEYYPESTEIAEDGEITIHIVVNSTAVDDFAYENDYIDLFVNVSGNTGFDSNITSFIVSEEAVEHDIEVVVTENQTIRHGKSGTYSFIVRNKNKGFIADRYSINITSENGFKLSYIPYIDDELEVYDETSDTNDEAIVNVTVTVPYYSDVSSDKLTFEIFSEHSRDSFSKTITVNTSVENPNILERIYKLFEDAAESLGINNLLPKKYAKYAGWILIGILLLILLIISVILIFIRKRRFVDLICKERIKEITSDETAIFEINIKNPYKKTLNYEIKVYTENEQKGFDISIDKTQILLEPEQSIKATLNVKPTDFVKPEDWVEVKVKAIPKEKNKASEISTVTTIKNDKLELSISGVFHWPRVFKKGDRVETSFKIFNRGGVSAEKITVFLFVNGEEKNKVEDIAIPRGGHADISIPWIAVKGKNEVYIMVK